MSNIAIHLVTDTFNKLMLKTKEPQKKAALKQLLQELHGIQGTNSIKIITDHLGHEMQVGTKFSDDIDRNSAKWGIAKASTTNTRLVLTQLYETLEGYYNYSGTLDINTFLLIESSFNACLERGNGTASTNLDTKKQELERVKESLLKKANRAEAVTELGTELAGQFGDAIDVQRRYFTILHSGETKTRQSMNTLLRNLDSLGAGGDLKNWMSRIETNPPLQELTMPGSHDAGVYDDPTDPRNKPSAMHLIEPDKYGVCHKLSIYNQACAGVRYFDIRIDKKGSDWYAVHETVLGTWGAKASKLLEDMLQFLNENPSEVLFYKCTHTEDKNYIEWMMRKLSAKLYRGMDQTTLLTNVRLNDVRGKIILLIENGARLNSWDLLNPRNPDYLKKFYTFTNKKDDHLPDEPEHITKDELVIYGGNSGENLSKIINGQLKKSKRLSVTIRGRDNHKNVFFQMSWTKMYGNIIARTTESPTGYIWGTEPGPHAVLDDLITYFTEGLTNTGAVFREKLELEITNPRNPLGYPNFLHLDNSSEETSRKILRLNERHAGQMVLYVPQIVNNFFSDN